VVVVVVSPIEVVVSREVVVVVMDIVDKVLIEIAVSVYIAANLVILLTLVGPSMASLSGLND